MLQRAQSRIASRVAATQRSSLRKKDNNGSRSVASKDHSRSIHTSPTTHGFNISRALGLRKKRSHAEKRAEMDGWRAESKAINDKAAAAGFKNSWVYKTAVIVERPEIIAPEPPEYYTQYQEWKAKWEEPINKQKPDIMKLFEEEDPMVAAARNAAAAAGSGKGKGKGAAAGAGKDGEMTEEEKERARRAEELKKAHTVVASVTVGPRITEADKKNDRKSLRRKLDRKLFLLVKKNGGAEPGWQFPSSPLDIENTTDLRQATEQGMTKQLSQHTKFWIAGNAPVGFWTHEFPAEFQQKRDAFGSKHFYYAAYYLQGNVRFLDAEVVDHVWVTKDELPEYLTDAAHLEYLKKILPAEGLY